MSKSLKIYIIFLILIFISIVYIDINSPKPINWNSTYSVKDKIPLGLYVLDKEIEHLFKNNTVTRFNTTPYEFFNNYYEYNDYSIDGTFIAISEDYFIDDQSTNELIYFVENGNDAFLSMKTFSSKLLDTLKLDYNSYFQISDSIFNSLANTNLGTTKYRMTEGMGNNYFSKIDTLNTIVLGYQTDNKEKRVNFIKIPYGNGNFYLHTQPAAFSNFHLLKDNHYEYAEKVLSYLKNENVFWFLKYQDGSIESSSPMRYILSHPSLRWTWYLFLIGMFVFILFNAKRKQRIVPIIKPLENTTVDFTKTIGNLYLQEGDHDTIINKKIIFFLEKIRQDYLLNTTVLDEHFIKKLQQKTGKDIKIIERAISLINRHRQSSYGSIEDDLVEINNAIEKIIN